MTRTAHFPHSTAGFPVYALAFLDDRTLVLGGGGGATRSGVKNKLKLTKIDIKGEKVETLDEFELDAGDDTPNSMAVNRQAKTILAGVNSPVSSLIVGENNNCRVFSLSEENKLKLDKAKGSFVAAYNEKEDFPYQKVTTFSRDGSLVAVGTSDNELAILSYPSLEPAFQTLRFPNINKGDLYDADFDDSGDYLVATTSAALHIYSLCPSASEKEPSSSSTPPRLKEAHIIPKTSLKHASTFRAARFGRAPTSPYKLYAASNAPPAKRGEPRRSYISSWDVPTPPSSAAADKPMGDAPVTDKKGGVADWSAKPCKTSVLAGKPMTTLDVNDSGKMLAYGCSDKSVGVIDAETFGPLLRILDAHELPSTALRFSPGKGDLLVSASADNSVRVIVIPDSFASTYTTPVALLFLALFLVFLAVLWQAHLQGGLF